MKNIMFKYLSLSVLIIFVSVNFIACGSQLYKVSVEEDVISRPNATNQKERKNPSSNLYGIHSSKGWVLPIKYQFGKGMTEVQKEQLVEAMKTWELAIGKKIFDFIGEHNNTDGDSFDDLYSSLNDDINGHYMSSNWTKTKKPSYVLATTVWNNGRNIEEIDHADIRFNNEFYKIGDTLDPDFIQVDEKEVVDMQSLALHEIGHLLGLAHVNENADRLSIMNSSLYIGEGLTSRKLSKDDIQRVQKIYGCDGNSCNLEEIYELISLR